MIPYSVIFYLVIDSQLDFFSEGMKNSTISFCELRKYCEIYFLIYANDSSYYSEKVGKEE